MPVKNEFLARHLNPVFVETGCLEGVGIMYATIAGFKTIYSIELNEYYYDMCRARFADNPSIHMVLGDSATSLWPTIENIKEQITFFLDAHFFNNDASPNPMFHELEAIARHPIKTHTILIDDIRLCNIECHTPWSLDRIKQEVLKINPNYRLSLETGDEEFPNDVLVAVP